mgnify:CR=1 FL=1
MFSFAFSAWVVFSIKGLDRCYFITKNYCISYSHHECVCNWRNANECLKWEQRRLLVPWRRRVKLSAMFVDGNFACPRSVPAVSSEFCQIQSSPVSSSSCEFSKLVNEKFCRSDKSLYERKSFCIIRDKQQKPTLVQCIIYVTLRCIRVSPCGAWRRASWPIWQCASSTLHGNNSEDILQVEGAVPFRPSMAFR